MTYGNKVAIFFSDTHPYKVGFRCVSCKNRILGTPSKLRALALEGCKKPPVAILVTNKTKLPHIWGGFLFFIFTSCSQGCKTKILPIVHKDVKQKYYFNEKRETKR